MGAASSATDTVAIDFEGEVVRAQRGESLAAALTGNGVRAFRTTRTGASRGVFCGMGVCQDCLVEVDGRANQRACMVMVDGPMQVRREAHARPVAGPFAGTPPDAAVETERPEILIIGAGPGGLAAARAAARAGAEVVVLDERSAAGGQFYKQVSVDGAAPPDRQHQEGRDLVDAVRTAGAQIRSEALVWGAFEPRRFMAIAAGRSVCFEPGTAIIATGAYERAWPVPGWTLPGVMTTGAAQTLWRTARRLPGRRVLIAGNGPLNLQLASELIEGGGEVVAVVEAARAPGLRSVGDIAAMARTAPQLLLDGLGYHRKRARGGCPMLYESVVAAIAPAEGSLSVSVAGAHNRTETVDAVCLGYGFLPSHELSRVLGCRSDYDAARGHLVTRRDADGATTVASVYALGDCTGMGGARVALAEGIIAGLAAAEQLGYTLSPELETERQRAKADAARHRRFQTALWRLFAPGRPLEPAATPETILCRCEEVTFADVEAALADGATSIGAVKRLTRAGMGRCQGRYCAPILEQYLARRTGQGCDEFSGFAPQVPVKPVAIADLAGGPDRV